MKIDDFSFLKDNLQTSIVGRELHTYESVLSSNETAYNLALAGAPEGTVVIADSQSGGRGRRGRSWSSPSGVNIYTSIILRPDIAPSRAPQLTLMSAVALSEVVAGTLADFPGINSKIKWPNDILLQDRKCAGILTEMKSAPSGVEFVVVGIGLNLNMRKETMDSSIAELATSLFIESGREFSREAVAQYLYSKVESWYKKYLEDGFSPVQEAWNRLSGIKGRKVRAASGKGYEEGIALGVDGEGALLLENETGMVLKITAGDAIFI
jgi:BirA family biotin operon repressor/biotin-[acetyl-CoA-carboxylase] ligase